MIRNSLPKWDGKSLYTIDEDAGYLAFNFDFGDDDDKQKKFRDKAYNLRNTFSHLLSSKVGNSRTSKNFIYPLGVVSKHWAFIEAGLIEHGITVPTGLDQTLVAVLETRKKQLADSIARGSLEFDDLDDYFVEGLEIVTMIDGEMCGGVVTGSEIHHGFFGRVLQISFGSVSNLTGVVCVGPMMVTIGAYDGLKDLTALPVRAVTAQERERLTERGRIFRHAVSKSSHYMAYTGQIGRDSWLGTTYYRADGRVMVDVKTMKHVDANLWSNSQRGSLLLRSRNDDDDDDDKTIQISDELLWTTYPYLFGFSFASKMWGRLTVSKLEDISWRTQSFEQLVLDEEEKGMVRALVAHQAGSFSDIIDGKGGGTIFLLHGSPGQGKTLTAEATAESLKRPLYSISVGELGTDPDQLEERLRQILDVADTWNAVLLLDEADIFLEARDEKDIIRNAMVGVFLRLLEYHQGVLFLTSNRAKNIDQAFLSRISVVLHYPDATQQKRAQIWTNLLSSAGIDGIAIDELSDHVINGRQIKNVIRLSQTLAASGGTKVTTNLISKVIKKMVGSISDLKKS